MTSAADLSTLSSRRCDADDDASVRSGQSLVSPDARSIQSVRSPRSPSAGSRGGGRFLKSESGSPSPTSRSGDVDHHRISSYSAGHNGSLGEADTPSPPVSPATPRPTKLSVSQTTLREGNDAFGGSEPPTPKASETPDTVRIFVPYPGVDCDDPPLISPTAPTHHPHYHHHIKSPQNGEPPGLMLIGSGSHNNKHEDPNKIKIKVDRDDPAAGFPSVAEGTSTSPCGSSPTVSINRSESTWSKPITLDSPEFNQGLM